MKSLVMNRGFIFYAIHPSRCYHDLESVAPASIAVLEQGLVMVVIHHDFLLVFQTRSCSVTSIIVSQGRRIFREFLNDFCGRSLILDFCIEKASDARRSMVFRILIESLKRRSKFLVELFSTWSRLVELKLISSCSNFTVFQLCLFILRRRFLGFRSNREFKSEFS